MSECLVVASVQKARSFYRPEGASSFSFSFSLSRSHSRRNSPARVGADGFYKLSGSRYIKRHQCCRSEYTSHSGCSLHPASFAALGLSVPWREPCTPICELVTDPTGHSVGRRRHQGEGVTSKSARVGVGDRNAGVRVGGVFEVARVLGRREAPDVYR